MEDLTNTIYKEWLSGITQKIKSAHLKTTIKVNAELLQLYWEIGKSILKVQKEQNWGSKIIENLAKDIKNNFLNSKGYSIRNLSYMRAFAYEYPDFPIVQVPLAKLENEFVQVALAQITWYHHISLLQKIKVLEERVFYIAKTAENEWSRDVMLLQVKSDLYNRSGKAITNFDKALPNYNSDLAKSIFKDPYHFSFLGLTEKVSEYKIENLLISKITDFLIELGKGFAYVGKQYCVVVDGDDYRIDLLFYHTQLHCYVVIELKAVEFKPEFISKLNFYRSAIDEQLKTERDEPTIGLLLCASKSNVKVEYAMRGFDKPLGVAEYELKALLEDNLKKISKTKLDTE